MWAKKKNLKKYKEKKEGDLAWRMDNNCQRFYHLRFFP